MSQAYTYQPMAADLREKHLKDILKNAQSLGTVKVPHISGLDNVVLHYYRIPLEYLIYNSHNKRFATRAKTLEKRLGELNAEKAEHVEHIEKFLWEYKKEKNEATIQSLIDNGQLDAGVVTLDGIILAGNRRFRLLNEIRRNPERYHADLDKSAYFEAAIIERRLDKRQILKFESFFQCGRDEKVDYGPIEKYLAIYEQKQEGFSTEEIYKNFQAIAKDKKQIEEWLDTFTLMDQGYLKHINEPGIYTALESREEHFLSLSGQLKQLTKRTSTTTRKMWAYEESDIAEYEMVAFDYIRMYVTVEIFRKLFKTFQDEKAWQEFFKHHRQTMGTIAIDSLDDYRSANPTLTEEELSGVRNNDFVSAVKKDFDHALRMQVSIQADEDAGKRPIDILKKIIAQIEKFQESLQNAPDDFDKDEVIEKLVEIQRSAAHLKQELD
jgi:hypothetical protein